MVIKVMEMMKVVEEISRKNDMKVAFKGSAKGAVMSGGGAFLGGLLGGPIGIPIGAAIGGLCGYATASDFKPVCVIIAELTPAEQRILYNRLYDITTSIDCTDAVSLIAILTGDSTLMFTFVKAISDFLTSDKGLTLLQS